jgi:hypothetical protein
MYPLRAFILLMDEVQSPWHEFAVPPLPDPMDTSSTLLATPPTLALNPPGKVRMFTALFWIAHLICTILF